MTGVLVAGVSVALVPAYAQAKDEQGPLRARRLVGTVLVWTAVAALAAAVLLWVFAEPIVAITGPGLSAEGTADEAVRYTQTLAPLVFLGAMSSIFFALCQAESLFPAMAVSTVSGPLLTLAIIIYFWDSLALDGLVTGTLVGAIVSLSILVGATVWRGIAPRPRLVVHGLGYPASGAPRRAALTQCGDPTGEPHRRSRACLVVGGRRRECPELRRVAGARSLRGHQTSVEHRAVSGTGTCRTRSREDRPSGYDRTCHRLRVGLLRTACGAHHRRGPGRDRGCLRSWVVRWRRPRPDRRRRGGQCSARSCSGRSRPPLWRP